jgi:SPP1 gp7 family putative phage head morphogenesis protein
LLRVRAHVETAVGLMRRVLGERFRQMLMAAAEREHFLTAVELTRWANAKREESAHGRRGHYVRDCADLLDGNDNRHDDRQALSEAWRDYLRLIIPAPALDFLEQIVGPLWRRVVGAINPERASNAVLQGIAAGKTRTEISKDLEGVFGGFESSARRVARTAGLEVATRTQLAVSEQIPDLVAGYELNTVLDDRVRPEHRAAHGRRFYRVPKDGQRPLSECPQPPIWGGQVAWICRCFLIPIIEIDGEEV